MAEKNPPATNPDDLPPPPPGPSAPSGGDKGDQKGDDKGKAKPATKPAAAAKKVESDLPATLPCREALIAAGLDTMEKVRRCGDLSAVPGVANYDVGRIRRGVGYHGQRPR